MQKIELEHKVILITGVAGFIGANLALSLLRDFEDIHIVGVDNMNDYYDVSLKEYRLGQIFAAAKKKSVMDCFRFYRVDISDKGVIEDLFHEKCPDIVVNLAAQAGVRYSLVNPDAYIESNIIGFYNILEACRNSYFGGSLNRKSDCFTPEPNMPGVKHLVYASSSSVYGANVKIPYSTDDKVDSPVSLYAATKKADELMAHAYAKLYNIPSTGLRFFTVYGPAGRPDMAYFGFTDKLRAGEKIKIFNYGDCKRDFTYIDDIVEGIIRVMQGAPGGMAGEESLSLPPHAVYNIGNSRPENLLNFVDVLQQELVRARVLPDNFDFEAYKELVPMQPGDVAVTYADTAPLLKDFGFCPSTSLRDGLRAFAGWYKEYYKC